MKATTIDQLDVRRIAVTGECSPATVERLLRGDPVRPLSRRRIERAMRELGIPQPRKRRTS
jgi:DNA-binding LacI/PurR family transcriptional regulator